MVTENNYWQMGLDALEHELTQCRRMLGEIADADPAGKSAQGRPNQQVLNEAVRDAMRIRVWLGMIGEESDT